MLSQEILEELQCRNDEALTADGFEDALIGIAERFGTGSMALYDYDKCIQILMTRDGMSYTEAVEFFEFNVIGAWMGAGTPCFATIFKAKEPFALEPHGCDGC